MNIDNNLRPTKLSSFIGQEDIINKLKIYIYSALNRKTTLDHILLYGPPGLGKTSLAYIIANEMHTKISTVNGGSLKEEKQLIGILGSLEEGEILFIDEIHNIDKKVEEILYSAMEDFKISIPIDDTENIKAMTLSISPFTLIAATTDAGYLSNPLRDRFSIIFNFVFYDNESIKKILENNSKLLDLDIDENSLNDLSLRCKNTPRIANNVLKRLLDYKIYQNISIIDFKILNKAYDVLSINELGLNETDFKILTILHYTYKDKPVSIESIAVCLNEKPSNIIGINEPYLIFSELIERTRQGRKITEKGISVLNRHIKK